MTTDVPRSPLSEADDAHPLDWYPEDAEQPEYRTLEEVEQWMSEMLTRREMVQYERGAGVLEALPAPYTTNLTREIVMPLDDIKQVALDAAVAAIQRAFPPQPRPKTATKPRRHAVRRGAVRAAEDLPWLAVPSLYFMQCTVCGLVKIGVSGDYRLRRIELEKTTGHRLRVLGFGYGDLESEAIVLGYFSPSRVAGEWFRPSDEILEYARRLQYHPDEDQP
jgi:hypothetical protein